MAKMKIDEKRQITLPEDMVTKLNLKTGEYLEAYTTDVGIVLVPESKIPKDQKWFWTNEWQRMYREALDDVKAGRLRGPFETVEELKRSMKEQPPHS